jgi:hypothetical protein
VSTLYCDFPPTCCLSLFFTVGLSSSLQVAQSTARLSTANGPLLKGVKTASRHLCARAFEPDSRTRATIPFSNTDDHDNHSMILSTLDFFIYNNQKSPCAHDWDDTRHICHLTRPLLNKRLLKWKEVLVSGCSHRPFWWDTSAAAEGVWFGWRWC